VLKYKEISLLGCSMATGIVKGEKLGDDALLADSARSEPFPLPSNKDSFELKYPNKL